MAILGTAFFGLIFLAGVAVLIAAISSNKKHSTFNKTLALAVKDGGNSVIYEREDTTLLRMDNGKEIELPKVFDPHLIMDQLAEIQHSQNVLSSYLNYLFYSFTARNERKFLEKASNYYKTLANTMASKTQVINAQTEMIEASNKLKSKQINVEKTPGLMAKLETLDYEEKIAEKEANIARYSSRTETIKSQPKKNDPFNREKRIITEKIDGQAGKQAGIKEAKQKYCDEPIARIKRGRDESQLTQQEREQIRKIERDFLEMMDEF